MKASLFSNKLFTLLLMIFASTIASNAQTQAGAASTNGANDQLTQKGASQPHDALYDTIARMDSVLFDAYNRHDLEKIKTLFTNNLEFYHDKAGLTNYAQNMAAFKETFDKNNGITRTLVPGSLQVYPVPNYGAMEIGSHTFCHKENGKDDCGTFQFAMVWQNKDGQWKISRVLSFGHGK